MTATGILVMVTLALSACTGDSHLTFLNPQGPIAALQRRHFIEVLTLLAVFVALPIFILIPWIAWRYRYASKTARYSPKWGAWKFLEIAVWSGPAVIVTMLGVLVWRSAPVLDPYRALPSVQTALRLQIIGYDWKWLFIYPDQGIASVGVLPLPTGRPLSIELTSATVMQSFFIPALGSQIYAMGGMVSKLNLQADQAGRFMGENTMYNGNGFHQQHFTAISMTPQAFDDWVRRTREDGMPLDSKTLGLLAKQTTFEQLKTVLDHNNSSGEGLYFKQADANVFADVVMATMNGSTSQKDHEHTNMGHATPSGTTMSLSTGSKP